MSPEHVHGRVELLPDEHERVADLLLLGLAQAPELENVLQLLHEGKQLGDGGVNIRWAGWTVA